MGIPRHATPTPGTIRQWSAACLLLAAVCSPGMAEDIEIIGSTTVNIDTLTRDDTANLFLGLGGVRIEATAYDRRDKPLRERFYREVAGMSAASVRAYWAKQVFTGRGRPPPLLDGHEVERILSGKDQIITYAPDGQRPRGAKTLLRLHPGEHHE